MKQQSNKQKQPGRTLSRRELLKYLAAGGAVFLIPACRGDTENTSPTPAGTPVPATEATGSDTAGATVAPTATAAPVVWTPPAEPEITPNNDFYTMKYHPSPPPEVDPAGYRLEITGEVDNPLSLSLEEIKTFPQVTEMRTLECISNPVGGNLIGNAVWTGVKMAAILEAAGASGRGRHLKIESLDGYHTGIPRELAEDEHAYLAFEMNGEPLPAKHGYPIRALWPGRYGQKQPKWIERITLQSTPHTGHFEGQGWSDDAFILPNSQILQPPPRELQPADFYIGGIAFTNTEGLEKVEVSLDNGASWQEATLLRGPSPRVWTHWWLYAEGLDNGAYRVLARVTDNQGRSQSSPERNSALLDGTFPNGTDEMHRVVVQVKI
jgi:DMSO/TMAO reductase YedYZ molybdopterin-dependent catalytic subunit